MGCLRFIELRAEGVGLRVEDLLVEGLGSLGSRRRREASGLWGLGSALKGFLNT